MSLVAGSIALELKALTDSIDKGFNNSIKKIGELSQAADTHGKKSENSFFNLGNIASVAMGNLVAGGVTKGIEAIKGLGQTAIDQANNFEIGFLKYQTLLGSAELAKVRIKELQDFAAKTPFETAEIQKADVLLQGFGIRSKGMLSLVGDAAAISGSNMGDLAMIMGQLSQSKDLGNIRQLVERGIISFDELKKAGIKFAKDGSVENSVEETFSKIQDIMGKKFKGGMDSLSNTFTGKWSTLMDTINIGLGEFALQSGLLDAVKQRTDTLIYGFGEVFKAVKLITSGDFTGSIFGFGEDSPFIGALFTARNILKEINPTIESIKNIGLLLISGDFKGGIFGLGEDSKLIDFLFDVRESFKRLIENTPLVKSVLAGLAAVVVALVIPALGGAITALGTFISTAVVAAATVAAPFLLIAGIVGGLYYAWETNFMGIKDIMAQFVDYTVNVVVPMVLAKFNEFLEWWKTGPGPLVMDFLNNVWYVLTDAFNIFTNVILPGLLAKFFEFTNFWNNTLIPAMALIWSLVQPGIKDLQSAFLTLVGAVLPAMKSFSDFFVAYIWPTIKSAIEMIWAIISALWTNVIQPLFAIAIPIVIGILIVAFNLIASTVKAVVNTAMTLWGYFGGAIVQVFSGIFQYLQGAMQIITGIFTGNGDKIREGFINIFSGIGNIVGGVFKGIINGIILAINSGLNSVNGFIDNIPEIPGIGKVPKLPTIPKFDKGVENFGGGLAYVHQGEVLANLSPGTTVVKADEVKDALGGGKGVEIHMHVPEGSFINAENLAALVRLLKATLIQEGIIVN